MDIELRTAILRNLVLKTKIVIGVLIAVLTIQTVGLFALDASERFFDVPMTQIAAIPVFIALVLVLEIRILKYLKRSLNGAAPFPEWYNYLISSFEVIFPTIVLYYGSLLFGGSANTITAFMFQNSPPLLFYFIMIVLSTFHFSLRLSLFSGILAGLGFVFVSVATLTETEQLIINVSKAPFLILTGFLTGLVARKLLDSVKSSLESKNALIHTLDQKVKERTAEVEAKKEELEIKNREITDSIVYAKRIQTAILPEGDFIREQLPDSFVLYQPKDIVAGDFYWMEKTKEGLLFAVADCTGHGVPGAMVSVVCCHALNQSVREFNKRLPGEILDKTRELVIHEFNTGQEVVRDGMDIALCLLNGKHLRYAGANNPVWIVRNGEVLQLEPTKQPVGQHARSSPFETKDVHLAFGDTVYLFSDGYADQFGGEKAKKFKSSNLKKLLLSIQHLPISQHADKLTEMLEKWRGSLEQVDDVCVFGFRV